MHVTTCKFPVIAAQSLEESDTVIIGVVDGELLIVYHAGKVSSILPLLWRVTGVNVMSKSTPVCPTVLVLEVMDVVEIDLAMKVPKVAVVV